MKYLLCLLISIITLSCGLPDVTGVSQEINQPIILNLIPGNNKIKVIFQAQNNEPAFSGYRIYFGDSVNPRKYTLYNSQKNLPTIVASKSETPVTYEFNIETGQYYSTNSTYINTLTTSEIPNGIPIYVWVSAYQISPSGESYYYDSFAKSATPRPEMLNTTINVGNSIIGTQTIATLVLENGSLYFDLSDNTSAMRIAGNSLDDIVVPPENGYSSDNIQVFANRLYLFKTTSGSDSYYSKIYVRSVNGTSSITIDFCYQMSANILSY